MLQKWIAVVVCAGAALASVAMAQDLTKAPTYGSIRLAPGFGPDPHVISVIAGGGRSAQRISRTCLGQIAEAPDFRLHYGPGGAHLVISAESSADTILVIHMPDGSWVCDDDGGPTGANPQITKSNPPAGTYDIWVGERSGRHEPEARLYISETASR
jgi:hypothetical protein